MDEEEVANADSQMLGGNAEAPPIDHATVNSGRSEEHDDTHAHPVSTRDRTQQDTSTANIGAAAKSLDEVLKSLGVGDEANHETDQLSEDEEKFLEMKNAVEQIMEYKARPKWHCCAIS